MQGDFITKGENGGNVNLKNVLCAPEVSRNILSLRKIINSGVGVTLSNQGIRLIDEERNIVVKRGPYDGKFWYVNFTKSNCSSDSTNKLSTLVSKPKTLLSGQSVTNTVVYRNKRNSESIGLTEEGSKVSIQRHSQVSCQNVCDEGFSAVAEEEHNYAKQPLTEYKHQEDCNSVSHNDHTYGRSLDQQTVNENNNELPESITSNDLDIERTEKIFEEFSMTNTTDTSEKANTKNLKENKGLLWHVRLGHVSQQYLEQASKFIPELKGVKFNNAIRDCETCIKAKGCKKSSPNKRFRNTKPLKLIHTDVMGPISPSSFSFGNRYIITFTDDATRYVWAYPMPDKANVHLTIVKLLKNIRNLKGQNASIQEFRLDNGTEYLTQDMKDLLAKEKINLSPVPPYTPDLNGTAERLNLTIQRQIRCLIFDSGFSKEIWLGAVDIQNKIPKKALNGKIPYTEFLQKPCFLKYIRSFGCVCHVLKNSKLTKFEERTMRGFLVSCNDDSYTIFEAETGKFWRSKNVTFIENKVYGDVFKKPSEKSVLEKEGRK